MGEVHAVPADDEGKREKDGGDDGENLHDTVLLYVDFGLKHTLNLGAVFTEELRTLTKSDDTLLEHFEEKQVGLREKAVFVFVKLAGDIIKLGIITKPCHGLLADLGHGYAERVETVSENIVLERLRSVLKLLETVQILGDELFKEVIEEPADTEIDPVLFLDHAFEMRSDDICVID